MNREQVLCDVCPKFCKLREGQIGFCRARSNIGGKIVPINYGQATSLALDPIEKKPLMRFCPGTYILLTAATAATCVARTARMRRFRWRDPTTALTA